MAAIAEQDLPSLLGRAQLVVIGTIDVETDELSAVPVRVEEVLRAPAVLDRVAGQVLALAFDTPPRTGQSIGLLVDELQLGVRITGHVLASTDPAGLAGRVASAAPAHDSGDTVVVGRVVDVQRVVRESPVTEHDPDWYVATVAVDHVEHGAVAGSEVQVLFANSYDTQWATAPKLRAAQEAAITLRPVRDAQASPAPYVVESPADVRTLGADE